MKHARSTCSSIALSAVALALCASLAEAQVQPRIWLEQQRLRPADDAQTGFGELVAVDGDTLAAYRSGGGGVVVFTRIAGTWTQQAVVPAGGVSMALDADTLATGAVSGPLESVRIYRRTGSTWGLEQTLSSGGCHVHFGRALALAGDRLCVAAPLFDPFFCGFIPPLSFFARSGSTWSSAPPPSIPAPPDDVYPGQDVAFDGSTLVSSAALATTVSYTKTWVWNYDGVNWSAAQMLPATDAVPADGWGDDVDLDGDTIVVSASRHDGNGVDSGAAYVFTRSSGTWSFTKKLLPCDPAPGARFGSSLAIDGNTIAVGAVGAVYVFTNTSGTWTQRQKITLGAAATAGGVGSHLALQSTTLAIAAPSEDLPYADAGAVYAFEREDSNGANFCFGDGSGAACPCGNIGAAGNGCAHSFNPLGARLDAFGLASVSDDRVKLACIGGPPAFFTLFFQGTTQQNGGLGTPTNDGLRCAGGSIVRLLNVVSCDGNVSYPAGTDLPVHVKGAIPPAGGTFYYQVWFRNVTGPCGTFSNYTNGVGVTWIP